MFGASIINRNLYHISNRFFNDQIQPFSMSIPQLDKNGTFNFNWRLTADPEIHNNQLDFSIYADSGPEMSRCMMPQDAHNYYFQDNYKNKYVQFIMSDRVPNCFLEAMERQDWFKYVINTEFMVNRFGTHKVPINARQIMKGFPRIA
jgi:hypothetical protein